MRSLIKTVTLSAIGVFIALFIFINIQKPHPLITSLKNIFPQRTSSHNLTPIHSNQWYSSLYKPLPSYPLFAFPLAFRLTEKGLGFSYPDVISTPQAIHAPFVEDFTVGLETSFTQQSLIEISDWSIKAILKDSKSKSIQFTLGHGIPFTTIKSSQAGLIISSPQPFLAYPNNNESAFSGNLQPYKDSVVTTLVLSTRNHYYLIAFPPNTTINVQNKKITTNSKEIYVALLNDRNSYDDFLETVFVEITSTNSSFKVTDNSVLTTYNINTSTNTPPLVTLFPHQTDFIIDKISPLGNYTSIRGPLTLAKTNSFTTILNTKTPNTTFPSLTNPNSKFIEQLHLDTIKVLSQKPPTSRDYYLGTYLGKVTSLIQLTESHGLLSEGKKLREHLKPILSDNLTHFSYDKEKTSLIAEKSEFGNSELNDHHFHYGYYIRTAAILASKDPNYFREINPVITQMVEDIATTNRDNSRYPHLRNFDSYEGHSWASGYAEFEDGNNQESSSESLNAWYSLLLWADATDDPELKKTAQYLFTTELTSIKYYWFNKNNIYKLPYTHQIASIVWGGKVDFSTWFSPQTNMIYGIQLLPFTPASLYLNEITPFSKYESDYLNSGGNYQTAWGDLMLMWKFLSESNISNSYQNRLSPLQEDNLPSLYLYFLYLNNQF